MKQSLARNGIFATIVCILMFAACDKKKVNEPNDIEFDTLRVAKKYHMDGDTTKPSCSVKLAYVYPVKMGDDAVMAKMNQEINFAMFESHILTLEPQQAMDEYVLNYINHYKEEMTSLSDRWSSGAEAPEYYTYYKIVDSKILFNEAGLVVYQIKSEDYKGGTKPMTSYRNLVLSAKTGDLVNEEDIFVDGYRSQLNGLLKNKLLAMYKVDSVDKLLEMGFFDVEDMSPNSNFVLDSDGITYVYSEREIAVPSLGESRIFLSYDELKDVLKADSPISILSGK